MIEKRWVRWIRVGDGCSLSFLLILSVVLDFISKSVPFYLKCLKCGRLYKLIYRLSVCESSRRKIGKRQPERLQKEGKVAAWLRMVSSIVAALLTPFFTSKNHTLNFFFWKNKYFFCELSQAGLSEFSWDGHLIFIRRRNSNKSGQNMWEWLRNFVCKFRHTLALRFEGIRSTFSYDLR